MYDGIIYITQNVSRHLVYATLFWFDSERSMFAYAKHSRIHSWNQHHNLDQRSIQQMQLVYRLGLVADHLSSARQM